MVTDSKRKNNISSNSKNSKNKNLSVIIRHPVIKDIKDIKGWELSNKLGKFEVRLFGGATAKDMESYIHPTIESVSSNVLWYK